MAQKRSAQHRPDQPFSCQLCYRRKVKCDRGNPCTYCAQHNVDCVPSPVETSDRPRKRRFPEASLLAKIKRYEEALLSYGADLTAINVEGSKPPPSTTSARLSVSGSTAADNCPAATQASSPHRNEIDDVLNIIDGEEMNSLDDNRAERVIFDRFFEDDGSKLLTAVDPSDAPLHPAPFDIFKLWQIYSDNVHPVCKTIHGPSFQRKISTFGSHLDLAPAADQALFFAVYLAAVYSLGERECEASFFSTKRDLERQYVRGTQFWLQRAGLWRTSDLAVLQAFVLFLSTQQNVVDPRALAMFTGMAERKARRLGLHRQVANLYSTTLVDQEIRRRVWWEIIFLDARTVEKAGMGNMQLTAQWSTPLPMACSDSDLEGMVGEVPSQALQPSSGMIFFLVRSETARFLANAGNRHSPLALDQRLQSIDELEDRIRSNYLCFCNSALPQHRLASIFASMIVARARLSAYLLEETNKQDGLHRSHIRGELLQQCTCILQAFASARGDPALDHFKWFLLHHMPIFAYLHLLRLLRVHLSGQAVDRAWQAVETFKRQGVRLPVDNLIMRAWRAREGAAIGPIEQPEYIKHILSASVGEARLNQTTSSGGTLSPGQSDDIDLLTEIMNGNTGCDFDWSKWISEDVSVPPLSF